MQGQSSPWHDVVQSLPHTTNSPLLWSSEEQSELLQGSPALPEAQARAQALSAEWDSIHQQLKADPSQHTDSEAYVFLATVHILKAPLADSLFEAVCMPLAIVNQLYCSCTAAHKLHQSSAAVQSYIAHTMLELHC